MKSGKSMLASLVAIAVVAVLMSVPVLATFDSEGVPARTITEDLVYGYNNGTDDVKGVEEILDELLGAGNEFVEISATGGDINVTVDIDKFDTIALDFADNYFDQYESLVEDYTIKVDGKYLVNVADGGASDHLGSHLALIADIISGTKNASAGTIYSKTLEVTKGGDSVTGLLTVNNISSTESLSRFSDAMIAISGYVSVTASYDILVDVVGGEVTLNIKDNLKNIFGTQSEMESKTIKQLAEIVAGHSAAELFGSTAAGYINLLCSELNNSVGFAGVLVKTSLKSGGHTFGFNDGFASESSGDAFQMFITGVVSVMDDGWSGKTLGDFKVPSSNDYYSLDGTLEVKYDIDSVAGTSSIAGTGLKITGIYGSTPGPTPTPGSTPGPTPGPVVTEETEINPSTGIVTERTTTEYGSVTKVVEVETSPGGKVINSKASVEDDQTGVSTKAEKSDAVSAVESVIPVSGVKTGNAIVVSSPDALITEALGQIKEAGSVIGVSGVTPSVDIVIHPSEASNVIKTEIKFGKEIVQTMADEKIMLNIKSSTGMISFGSDVAKGLSIQKDDVSIVMGSPDEAELTEAQKETIGDRATISIVAKSGAGKISQLGGEMRIGVYYDMQSGEDLGNLEVWCVNSAGSIEKMNDAKYDTESKVVSFATPHLSLFAISFGPDSPDSGGMSAWAWVGIAVVVILIVGAAAYYFLVVNKKKTD